MNSWAAIRVVNELQIEKHCLEKHICNKSRRGLGVVEGVGLWVYVVGAKLSVMMGGRMFANDGSGNIQDQPKSVRPMALTSCEDCE